jgi:putative ABC transport system permease protein
LSRAPGVDAFYAEYLVDAETPAGRSFQVRAVEGDVAAFPFRIAEGRFFEPGTYEAIAGQGLLDWLGLAVGDEITLTLEEKDERPTTWRIVGRYAEPLNAGQMLMVSLPSVQQFLKQAKPDTYCLRLSPSASSTRLKAYLEPGPDSDLNVTLVGQAVPEAVLYLQLAIFALSAILIGIALVNVFNSSLLAVQERLRMVGVLKTLGMTPAQVVAMVNTTAGFLGLLAVVVGLPLGLAFTRGLLATVSKTFGFGEVSVSVNLLYVLMLIPAMVAVSAAGSLIPARWAAHLPIVSVLREE